MPGTKHSDAAALQATVVPSALSNTLPVIIRSIAPQFRIGGAGLKVVEDCSVKLRMPVATEMESRISNRKAVESRYQLAI